MRARLSSGQDVRIVFKHTPPKPNPPDDGNPFRYRIVEDLQRELKRRQHWVAKTECLLVEARKEPVNDLDVEIGHPKIIAMATAFCSWKDQFVKEQGRLVALRRAIADLSTDDRKTVFDAYTNRPRAAKKQKSPSPTQ